MKTPVTGRFAALFVAHLLAAAVAGEATEIPNPVRPVSGYEMFSVMVTRTLSARQFSVGGDIELIESPDVKRFSAVLAYGITDDLEVGGVFPYTAADDREAVGDLGVIVKYRLFHEGRYGPALGVAVGINLPTGERDDNSVSGNLDLQALVVGTKRLGPFSGHVNVGYTLVGESSFDDVVTAAVGLEFSAAHRLTILGELYTQTARVPDTEDMVEWRVGYKIKAPGGITSKVGVGFPFGDRSPDYRIILGLTWIPDVN